MDSWDKMRLKDGTLLMSIESYRKHFAGQMKKRNENTLKYFDSMSEPRSGDVEIGMLHFPNSNIEWVPGGPWPGNYGMYRITNFNKVTNAKGRKKVKIEGGYNYVDWKGMNDVIPYPLKTTKQNILAEVKIKKHSIYNIPHRFYKKYSKQLLIKIGDTVCQDDALTKEMLAVVLKEMTPAEKSVYEQSLYKINVDLYPSIELPVMVRITGIDDGAEESLFPTTKKAKEAMMEIAVLNLIDRRRQLGFRSCD